MSSQNLKNKSIDELREMKAKGEAELKVLANVKYHEQEESQQSTQKSKQEIIE